jgi:hypothetical protein
MPLQYACRMYRASEMTRIRSMVAMATLLIGAVGLLACNDADSRTADSTRKGSGVDEVAKSEAPPAAIGVVEQAAPLAHAGQELTYNFDSDSQGQMPPKFHSARTGAGEESRWLILGDSTAPSKPNVIAQTSGDHVDYRFPLLITDEASFLDLDVTVSFKAVSGNIDRAGGLVFRLKDPNNYYVVRANALENNYNLYHVVNGRRSEFAGAKLKVTSGEWHQLRVEVIGNKITCYYDGNKKIEATDETFKDAGKIGLWTKADSVTYFDDLRVAAR